MYGFWYDYMKPKYGEKEKLCYMDTRSFIAYIKTEDMYSDIAKDVKRDLILQIMNLTDHYLKEKTKKLLD